jgi:hypothetical protein
MNAAKQELFESVRAVVAGRLRDEAQVREIAYRVSEESTALRRRMERAVGYARAGLRLEACAEAEAEPTVFELAAAFDTDVMRQWRALCAKNRLPVQDEINVEALTEIEEAITLTAPLRRRLANMRRLVLSDASAWHRLEALRELISRDPGNPAWQEDRAALEPVTADELGDRFEASLRDGKLEDAELCVARLEQGNWHWGGAAKVGAQLRATLDRALSERTAAEAREVVAQLDAEWSAESEDGARAAMQRWRDLEQRMLSYGGDMPADLLSRVDEVEAWLAAREADTNAIQENRDRVSELERLLQDESSTLSQLKSALRAAEQTFEGVPEDVRANADRRINAFERAARLKRVALVAVVVLLLAGAAVAAVMLARASERSTRIENMARAVVSNIEAGRLDDAERQLKDSARDIELSGSPQIAEAKKRLAAAREAIESKARRFRELMGEAGDAASPSAKPDKVEEAKELVQTDDEQVEVAQWLKSHSSFKDATRTKRMQDGLALASATVRAIADAVPNGDASWDGQYTAWESALSDVQRQYGEFAEVRERVDAGKRAVETQRAKTEAARVEGARLGKLAVLGAAATSPATLAAALETYCKDHPESPECGDFGRAIAARPSWDSVVAWGEVKLPSAGELAKMPQEGRDKALLAIMDYADAHPSSPYGAALEELKKLLGPGPAWRQWLKTKLSDTRSFKYWMIETKDGVRNYSQSDPRLAPLNSEGGVNVRTVKVIQDKGLKERLLPTPQLQIKSEGPSPQMEFAKAQGDRLDSEDKEVNDVYAAFDAIEALRKDDSMDGALAASLMRGLLEKLAADEEIKMPEAVRVQCAQGVKRIAREKPDDIDWLNPADRQARERSKAARAAMREAAQPDLWRKQYVAALETAQAPLARLYEPFGILVKPDGKAAILTPGQGATASGTVFWIAEPPVGEKLGVMVKLGVAKAGGGVEFEPALNTVPAGTLVFTVKPGAKP